MTGRLLIICPHFPPTNAADGQRVRICAKGLIDRGFDLDVLACNPDDLDINQSPMLSQTLPGGLRVHHVPCRPNLIGRAVGASTTSRNAFRFIRSAGDRLLRDTPFDGVLFSTTAFGLLRLGVRWRQRYGTPFVVDLQDPWLQELPAGVPPPGGRLRFSLAMAGARRWERRVMTRAAGIVSVSPAYQTQLTGRYPELADRPFLTLPFGAAAGDLNLARSSQVRQSFFDPGNSELHLVHVGRGGEDLWLSLRPLLKALSQQGSAPPVTLHLIGTSYAPSGRQEPSLTPLIEQMDNATALALRVREYPARIDYFQALRCMSDASGIVVLTSNDPAYNASKIHNCVLAGPPVLALVHPGSVAQRAWDDLGPQVTLVDCQRNAAAADINRWIEQLPQPPTQVDNYRFEADRQAAGLAAFLNQVLAH